MQQRTLKQCGKNISHIWMADLTFCPYCYIPADERSAYVQRERAEIAEEKRKAKTQKPNAKNKN